ncbi:succinate dehydrogenase, cytochrome b556 subunit [Candidatus Riesia pediculischaeffi]|nr:succinate dehydrogenase, cytochrome b556 subunit [Candidatus Riesia pediculischaeffi]
MNKKNLINLDLDIRKLPINAMVSILHRISGIMNIFFLMWIVKKICCTVEYREKFFPVLSFRSCSSKIIFYIFCISFIYHVLSGVRHMLIDFNIIGYSITISKVSSVLTIISTFIIFFLLCFL